MMNKLKLWIYNKLPIEKRIITDVICGESKFRMPFLEVGYFIKGTNIIHNMNGPAIIFDMSSEIWCKYYISGVLYKKEEYYKAIGKEYILMLE